MRAVLYSQVMLPITRKQSKQQPKTAELNITPKRGRYGAEDITTSEIAK